MKSHLRTLTALLSLTFVLGSTASQAGSFSYTIYDTVGATGLASVTLDQLLHGYWIEQTLTGGASGDIHLGFQNWDSFSTTGVDPTKVAVTPEPIAKGFGLAFTSARQFQAVGGGTQVTSFSYDVVTLAGTTAPTNMGLTLGGHYTAPGGYVKITDVAHEVPEPADPDHTISASDPGSMEAFTALDPDTDTVQITKTIELKGGDGSVSRPRTTKLTRFDQWITATDPVPESSVAQLTAILGLGGLALLRRRLLR